MLKGFSRKTPRPKIGVIGSVLIDIIATTRDDSSIVDATGKVDALNIGGCAYNIAFYLRRLGAKVSIYSVVRDRSPLTPFIISKLQAENIDRRWIRFERDVPEGVFVAHKSGTDVSRAVTSTCMDSASLDDDDLARFVRQHDLIVCDMGLRLDQLSSILRCARKYDKHLICNGTSDSRISRVSSLGNVPNFFALVMNQAESKSLIPDLDDLLAQGAHKLIRRKAHANNVIITRGKDGMVCIDADDNIRSFERIDVSDIKSTIGAGDALTACVVMSALELDGNVILPLGELGDFNSDMKIVMPMALGEDGATKGSSFLFDRRVVKYGFKERKENTVLKIDREHWGLLGYVIAVLIGILAWIFPLK